MALEVRIGNELASLTVSITEFTRLIRQLTGAVKDDQFRKDLRAMISEVRRSYDSAVDAFTPFYKLDTKRKFGAGFERSRTAFKSHYLKDVGGVRTRCDKVTSQLQKLQARKRRFSKLPGFKRSFQRLEDLASNWVANDRWLALNMEYLLKSLNRLLNEIARVKRTDSAAAFVALTAALEDFEALFLAVKKNLDTLDVVSAQL